MANNSTKSGKSEHARPVTPSTFAALMTGGALLVLLAGGDWVPLPLWLRLYGFAAAGTIGAAVVALWRVVRASGEGHGASTAWKLLFFGMYLTLLGQVCLLTMRFSNAAASAGFPTSADIFFIAGQILLDVGLIVHLWAYSRTGLPLGSRSSYAVIYTAAGILIAVLVWKLNIPMWIDPAHTWAWKAVTTTYNVLDAAALCAALALLRIAVVFRGGAIAQGWAALAISFVFMMLGDLLFGIGVSDQISALVYFACYVSLTFGAMRHREVIESVG